MQNKSTKAMLTIISCFMLIVIADFLTAKTVKNRIFKQTHCRVRWLPTYPAVCFKITLSLTGLNTSLSAAYALSTLLLQHLFYNGESLAY